MKILSLGRPSMVRCCWLRFSSARFSSYFLSRRHWLNQESGRRIRNEAFLEVENVAIRRIEPLTDDSTTARKPSGPPSNTAWLTIYSLVGLISVGIFWQGKKSKKPLIDRFPTAVYRDPHTNKTGHLIFHEGTWLSEYLFPKRRKFEEIRDFKLNEDDVLVVSFPKSGTTWVQEIACQLLPSRLDGKGKANMEERFPYLEYIYPDLKEIAKRPSPRFIKTHLPYHLLPSDVHKGTGKVIYIARNAKDVCVSYYHFVKLLSFLNYTGDFDHFVSNFLDGTVSSGPWLDHVARFWSHRNDTNILFITYEDLHQKPAVVIKQIAEFLDVALTDQELEKIVRATRFSEMKGNDLVNYSWWDDLGLNKRHPDGTGFMRKGVVGDWRNHLSAEWSERIERDCLEPLKRLELTFTER